MKPKYLASAKEIFSATEIKITTDGKRHLGATIGSTKYRDHYVTEKIDNLCKALHLLSEIGKIEPQAAYAGLRCHQVTVREFVPDPNLIKKKSATQKRKLDNIKGSLQLLDALLNESQKRLLSLNQEHGASSWFSTLPLENEGYLCKQCFQDLIRIRYGYPLRGFHLSPPQQAEKLPRQSHERSLPRRTDRSTPSNSWWESKTSRIRLLNLMKLD